jgi:hypothetical protein
LIPGGIVPVADALAAVVLTGCAAEEPTTYGPTVAGPTITAKTSAPVAPPSLPEDEQPVPRVTGKSLCELFSPAEISATLGLPVGKVAVSKDGPYSVCTWKSPKGWRHSHDYPGRWQLLPGVREEDRRGRQDQEGPRAQAARRDRRRGLPDRRLRQRCPDLVRRGLLGGVLTGIEVSGAGSKASIATAKGFMIEILARG